MRKYKVKEINSLSRGVEVFKHLHAVESASLHELHQALAIPKSTLTRILLTLHSEGLVWARIADGRYLASSCLQHHLARDDPNRLAELASPLLLELGESVPWPSVICIPCNAGMRVIETNSPMSYFDALPHGPIGFRANMLRSASGRAYISFCDPTEREAILEQLRATPAAGHELAFDPRALKRLIAQTRNDGFARRAPDFGGDYARDRSEIDDQRESIALPLLVHGRVLASVNLTWKRKVISIERAIDEYLPKLQATIGHLQARCEAIIPAA